MPSPRAAVVFLDPHFTVGEVDPLLFGSFVEHLGRCVYTGLFEPDHPAADATGLRTDVLALIRELGVTMVRYPGGNFVSAYRWEDGVGPADLRPRRLDPAWRTIETNRFGLGEFAAFTRAAGLEPMMAVNLGTRDRPRRPTCWSTATTPAAPPCRTCAVRTAHRSRTASACGAWATSWTGRGRSGTRPPTSTAAWPPRPPG